MSEKGARLHSLDNHVSRKGVLHIYSVNKVSCDRTDQGQSPQLDCVGGCLSRVPEPSPPPHRPLSTQIDQQKY